MEELILKPIQTEIFNQVRDAFKKSRRIVLQAATSAGKTAIAAKIIQSAVVKGKRVLFIADRIVLVLQTSKEFSKWGIRHGIIMGDHPDFYPDRQVQIGSAATLAKRDIDNYDMIIQDEAHAHHVGAQKAFDQNPDAFILGMTASPYAKGMGKIFDFHIQPFTVRDLIERGLLCDYDVYGPAGIDLEGVRVAAGEYRQDDLGKAVDKPKLTASIVETYLKLAKGKKAIVFSTNVAHGRALQKEFKKHGVTAKEINAYLPKDGPESANEIIDEFRQDKFKVLISVSIIIKGFSVSNVEVVVLATATKSMIKLTQAIGRGLRLSPGKKKALILDHGSNFSRLGFPEEYEFLELDDGKHKDSKNKKQEKKEQLPKACPSCSFIKPPGVRKCPACQFTPEFIQDVEFEEGELKKLQRKTRGEYSLEEKQSFLAQLNRHAANKGFKKGKEGCYGWSIHQYSTKFGGEPPSRIAWNSQEDVGEEVRKFIISRNIAYAKRKQA